MEPDEQAEQAERKRQINNFIWECGPESLTLKEAEKIACGVFVAFERVRKTESQSSGHEAMSEAMEEAG